ncbi:MULTISPECIES: hypothetical protein [Flavobacteriaceae]|uniref:Protocatechuate 3,4-dioxygenase beta subunit n=1 Tax=Meridianimaribacter flavus TaxID=571115 RepID=A0ABY2G5I2_9FLAO|nr:MULTISPECIES: hypothetical protein [Meridianimaribacter]TBV26610.1 hypothetical protein DMZ43_05980 [Meridianimaribacter sp. CL38]TDY12293.1 protocatechuate 3,4-dioxygenase beta subunit [Meridianimaribacter flavus]
MKNVFTLLFLTLFASTAFAQNTMLTASIADEIPTNYKKRSPVYDYTEVNLNNVDTIPGFDATTNKLKLTGTIYLSDGVTPAKDVVLYIEHADEAGEYDIKKEHGKKYIEHRGWVKTDANGTYTLYTFMPGEAIIPITQPERRSPKQIFPIVKVPGEKAYNLSAFMFDNDPLITKTCRKRLKRKGIDCLLTTTQEGDMLVATKDIILKADAAAY